jgi:hypothetical protein
VDHQNNFQNLLPLQASGLGAYSVRNIKRSPFHHGTLLPGVFTNTKKIDNAFAEAKAEQWEIP